MFTLSYGALSVESNGGLNSESRLLQLYNSYYKHDWDMG